MITVTAHARELLRSYEHLEGTVLRLDPANGHSSEEDVLANDFYRVTVVELPRR
jgi:hypothetical protein